MAIHKSSCKLVTCLALTMLLACQPRTTPEASHADDRQQKPLEVTEIVVGSVADQTLRRPMAPKDPIEVTVRTVGTSEDAELLIKVFTLADGTVVGTKSIVLDGPGGAEQSIRFQNDVPWKPGRYLVEVTLDGKLVGHRELEIYPEGGRLRNR